MPKQSASGRNLTVGYLCRIGEDSNMAAYVIRSVCADRADPNKP